MANWLSRILPAGVTGTQRVSYGPAANFGGAHATERTSATDNDPRYAQKHSSGVHGAVEGTGENGRHRLDMYM